MIQRLMEWMDESTCNFMAAQTISLELDKAGFIQLDRRDVWYV